MKKSLFLSKYQLLFITVFFSLTSYNSLAQNVAISDDDAYTPHSSAMLDVKSLTKGFLAPRMSTVQRSAILSPESGLLVFDTDLSSYFLYNGTTWTGITTGNASGIWSYSSPNIYTTSSSDAVGIGTSTPYHKLHVNASVAVIDGTDGNFIDIQNSYTVAGAMSGIRFCNGNYGTPDVFKGAIFYQDATSYNRGDLIFANNSGANATNVSATDARMVIKSDGRVKVIGSATAANNDALFSVENANGDTVFAVYPEGVRISVADDPAMKAVGSRGGFAVGGFSSVKGLTNEYLYVSPDSVRVYIEEGGAKALGSKGGFAVGGFSSVKAIPTDYFNILGSGAADVVNPSEARIFWYPLKEALLSGHVLVESPDSVGTNSFASGYESRAIGNYSQAMGYQCTARGLYATAIGYRSMASGPSSFALGNTCISSGQSSTALGAFCSASNDDAFAMGFLSVSSGIGSIALGIGANSSGTNTLAMGVYSAASGNNAIALGSNTICSGADAVALGYDASATGNAAICLGDGLASGDMSYSAGLYTIAQAYSSFVIGRYNAVTGTTNSWVSTEPLFVIGIGTSSATRANAMTVLKNGQTGIGTASPNSRLHVNSSSGENPLRVQLNGSTKLYVNSTNGGTSIGTATATAATNGLYVNGNTGLGTSDPGSNRLYVTSSLGGTSASSGYIVNSASNGLALMVENSSSSSNDNVVLITQRGSTGDILSLDSYHGIGVWEREFKFTNSGIGYCDGSWQATGADYAEYFPKAIESDSFEPGDVISISDKGYFVEHCNDTYSTRVLGVVSSNPAIVGNSLMGSDNINNVLVGLMGVVTTKVSSENGEINVGDFVTTSSEKGVAMKAKKSGIMIGRALESYSGNGTSDIKVLVSVGWVAIQSEEITLEATLEMIKNLEKEVTNLKSQIGSVSK